MDIIKSFLFFITTLTELQFYEVVYFFSAFECRMPKMKVKGLSKFFMSCCEDFAHVS